MVTGLIPRLGNDLVAWNLGLNRGKSSDQRFARRVFSPDEQHLIVSSGRPDVMLWQLWAAKEACYKAASQSQSLAFSPVRFAVDWDQGVVLDPHGHTWFLAFHEGPGWVHVWACSDPVALARVRTRVGEVGTEESIGVRQLALGVLADEGLTGALISGLPPQVLQGGTPVHGRLSLSHDEGYGAVAWLSGER